MEALKPRLLSFWACPVPGCEVVRGEDVILGEEESVLLCPVHGEVLQRRIAMRAVSESRALGIALRALEDIARAIPRAGNSRARLLVQRAETAIAEIDRLPREAP